MYFFNLKICGINNASKVILNNSANIKGTTPNLIIESFQPNIVPSQITPNT
jgi:hypothetical protein